jgi:hypothetical protein
MSVEINQTTKTIIYANASAKDLNNLPYGVETIIIGVFLNNETLNLPVSVSRLHISEMWIISEKFKLLEDEGVLNGLKVPYGCVITGGNDQHCVMLKVKGSCNAYNTFEMPREGINKEIFKDNIQVISYTPNCIDINEFQNSNYDVLPSKTNIKFTKKIIEFTIC